jgi:hypothetical protein
LPDSLLSGSTLDNETNPVLAIERDLVGIQFSVEATTDLRLPVTIEAEYGEILFPIVRRILIKMMNLNWLSLHSTNAACAVVGEEHTCSDVRRYFDSLLSQ